MGRALKKHWAEFDEMVSQLGALRLERDGMLDAARTSACRRALESFEAAVAAVCRFGGERKVSADQSAVEVWAALERAEEAAWQAGAVEAGRSAVVGSVTRRAGGDSRHPALV